MAGNEDTTVAPGVTRRDCYWGYLLEGHRDALVASGLVQAAWFAGEVERDKCGRIIRTKYLVAGERKLTVRIPARGKCSVHFHYTEAEYEAAKFRKELGEAREREAKQLADLPDSHERFREQSIDWIEHVLDCLRRGLERGRGGYRFSAETVDAFEIAASNVLQTLHQGRSTFDRTAHQQRLGEIHADAARLDPGLRRFLDGLGSKG